MFYKDYFYFMSLVICNNIPNLPLKALIVVFIIVFTVHRTALFSYIFRTAKFIVIAKINGLCSM